jgi:hypothetical protein
MDKAVVELIMLNQHALRAAIEELSLWIRRDGGEYHADNVMIALQTLDANAEGIEQGIRVLRGDAL